ncbi:MAG: hypothetical protein KGI37_06305 [Alphaproteobacteria bacterium]|nr:hypothetical protein [Alphaproteobacteria bacterium]
MTDILEQDVIKGPDAEPFYGILGIVRDHWSEQGVRFIAHVDYDEIKIAGAGYSAALHLLCGGAARLVMKSVPTNEGVAITFYPNGTYSTDYWMLFDSFPPQHPDEPSYFDDIEAFEGDLPAMAAQAGRTMAMILQRRRQGRPILKPQG